MSRPGRYAAERRTLLAMVGRATMDAMYPDDQTLMEIGRIAVAAGRLDAALGAIWWHLAPDQVDELAARRAPAGQVRAKVSALADERLDEPHAHALRALVEEVAAAQIERNEVLHSDLTYLLGSRFGG